MPVKIPPLQSQKFRRLLETHGAAFVRQKGTSHAIYERIAQGRTWRAPVVAGRKELSPKYIKVVLQQLGFTAQEIDELFS